MHLISRSWAFIKLGVLGFFPRFSGLFFQIFQKLSPLFFLISCQFDPFSPYLNYVVIMDIPEKINLLKFGVFPHCAFIPSCVFIKIGRSFTLCVYFSLFSYKRLKSIESTLYEVAWMRFLLKETRNRFLKLNTANIKTFKQDLMYQSSAWNSWLLCTFTQDKIINIKYRITKNI